MNELLPIALGALPGIAAVAVAGLRWRRSLDPVRRWRRASGLSRLALVALAALTLAACHTTHRGHFATTPVPLALVPFQEPLRYTIGPSAGQPVPAQNGLLASYFAGALYDRLDHQQLDPNIDFDWNAENQNPVVSGPESLDTNEGIGSFIGLPATWGIWSIAWEGYLDVPADGTYGIRLHVNNGGWLETKDGAGGLRTVLSCPGGPSFEGDCDATLTLATGRQYIRVSYYQNGPPSANAHLSWQRPGDAGFAIVPTASLFTQATSPSARSPLIFVPGFGGSQLVAGATRSNKTLTTSEGTTKQVSYASGDLIWLDIGRAAQAVVDPEFFDILRFNDDGTTPSPSDFGTNGRLVTLPGAYDEVERALTAAGYVKDQTYFLFTYDFRFGAETWVPRLDDLVVRALAANPRAQGVDILAHSMGTLVTRAYLVTGAHAGNVHATVLMGGPLLGTPKGNYAATGGTCVTKIKDVICVLREQTEQFIIRTLPGGLELGASSDYYPFFQGQDREHPVAYLDRSVTAGLSANRTDYGLLHETELALQAGPAALAQAEAFHRDDLGWLPPRSANVSLVVGSGLCTIGQVVAYSKPTYRYSLVPSTDPPFFRVVREFAGYVIAYDTSEIDGDGTVVRQSASLSDPGVGLAANGNARVYYRAMEHGALAGAVNLAATALPLLRGEIVAIGSVGGQRCTQVSTHSPVEILITDDAGRRIGRTSPDDVGFDELPGGVYDRYSDMRNIALNAPGRFTASVRGTGRGDATIRVRWLDGARVSRMAIFAHVPTTAQSQGTFVIDDGLRSAGDLTVDLNGDGRTVLTFKPVVLEAAAAEDAAPPDLTIDAPQDGQAVVGSFAVSWTARDAVSGIGTSGAAIDLAVGGPLLDVPGAAEVAPGTHLLDVFAEDRAGNLSTRQRSFTAYAFEWLPPLVVDAGWAPRFAAGRTIPARFVVRRTDGTPVIDPSVAVDLVDGSGQAVLAALTLGGTPAHAVTVQNGTYHADVRTAGLAPGAYAVRVRFGSAQLTGELKMPITLQ